MTAGSAPASISERLAAPPASASDHEVSLTFINVELGRSVFDLISEASPCAVPCRNWLCGTERCVLVLNIAVLLSGTDYLRSFMEGMVDRLAGMLGEQSLFRVTGLG